MGNTEKIKTIMKEYKSLFKSTDMDICQSVKGRWYFTRYNEELEYYDCFREFETAEELIEIIVGELAMEMNFAIENEPEPPKYDKEDLADVIENDGDYEDAVDSLAQSLETILKMDHCEERVALILKSMLTLIQK